jgi:hypothetical protein
VFAVPGTPAARYETVLLPENEFERLRVTVFRGADDPPLLEIRGVTARDAADRPRAEVPLSVVPQPAEAPRRGETVLTVDLGARLQPVSALVLDVATPRFLREVVVEERREPARERRPDGPPWTHVASGVVFRGAEGVGGREQLRIEACVRTSALRVRILDRDDEPLALNSVTVLAPAERVLFEARPERRYALEYGRPDRGAPSFDLVRTVDPARWSAEAASAALGPPLPAGPPRALAWTERHPGLLLAGLVAAVAALGALTWRAVRAAA